MHRTVILLLACFALTPLSALALESDRDQSALIEADEVELDFGSGKRIYRGNVSVRQGTIRILADEIELFYRGEQLDHAVAKGNPAVFRQRPEGKDHDIIGTGPYNPRWRRCADGHLAGRFRPAPAGYPT